MKKEFVQASWDADLQRSWERLLELAIAEDLGDAGDLTSLALVPPVAAGRAAVVARQAGVLAGAAAAETTLARFDPALRWTPDTTDADAIVAGQTIGRISGPVRGLLAAERPLLNLVGRLSGIASLTRKYVEAVAGTQARIYDTRKTTPAWRKLEKYAVRCGGGFNHRGGLFEAVLIKDNHLALGAQLAGGHGWIFAGRGGRASPTVPDRPARRGGPPRDRRNRGRYARTVGSGANGSPGSRPSGQHESGRFARSGSTPHCAGPAHRIGGPPAVSIWPGCGAWRRRASIGSASGP